MKEDIPPHIQDLLDRYINETLTPAEMDQLDHWFKKQDEDFVVVDQQIDRERLQNKMKSRLDRAIEKDLRPHKMHRPKSMTYLRVAGVVLLVATIGYFMSLWIDQDRTPSAAHYTQIADVPAPINNAYLVREDHDFLDLTKLLSSSEVPMEMNAEVLITPDGILSFQHTSHSSESETVIEQLQIVVPKGSFFEVVLPDGSKVSLNAYSSLSFPSQFVGPERLVSLSGEAYFEVASDPANPFIVQTARQEIKVTGTAFNVSAYEDDVADITALFEGKVSLRDRSGRSWVDLIPGQIGTVDEQGVYVKDSQSLDHLIAWKSKIFEFEQESIDHILRKVSRWYDVQFEWDDSSRRDITLLNGKIRKEAGLKEVLKMLSLAAKVDFYKEDARLMVKRQQNLSIK